MKILGTGLKGLVGSRIAELLKDVYELEISDIDITDRHKLFERIKNSNASIVLHLAAKTDVDGCEKDKEKDQELLKKGFWTSQNDEDRIEEKTAWGVNVIGTKNVADACLDTNKKLIYISTDFVFEGTKDSYSEEDIPNPVNWYAQTKYEGEKIVQCLSSPWIIARIAYPYRASFERNDFFRAILQRLKKGEPVKAVMDHVFCPTFTDDIAFVLDVLIKNNSLGIFHAVGGGSLTPYEATIEIAKVFNCDESLISKTTRLEFFKDRAKRPFQLALKNDRIEKLGIKMRTFDEGLKEVRKQISNS